MRRYVIDRPGSYDKLALREAPSLVPGDGEVVIDVRAAGVNYADTMVRMGLYQSAKEFVGWPITPGFEVAGVVQAVGAGVTDLAVGERVLAVTLFNGYASQVKALRQYVFRTPERLSDPEAAGFPSVYLTAWFALFELAHPHKGDKVLIHSAAGGVGGCLVQLARLAGCEVTAVVGAAHKIDTARAHGADHVIDKSSEDLWARAEKIAPEGYDVICDANGVSTLKQSYQHLRRAGKLVVYGFHSMLPKGGSGRPSWIKLGIDYLRTPRFNPLDLTNDSKSVLAFNLSYLFDRKDILEAGMGQLTGWLSDGKIAAPPVKTYPFDRAADAHRDIESGQTVGKLVLTL
ncbi:MAG: zinc-binding dehydrogenase [Myxococcales bacterium]|nr:zinc-binding dehydrogenase [Myxococcales bacterium]